MTCIPLMAMMTLAFSATTAMAQHQYRPASPSINSTEMRCIVWAAHHYHEPTDPLSLQAYVDLLVAIRLTEGGQPGHISWNHNGSYDIGPMQINSTHLAQLQQLGISYQSLLNDACENIIVGAWILHANLVESRDLWTSIGNYNSHTAVYNVAYQRRIWSRLQSVWAAKLTNGVLDRAAPAAVAETTQ